MIRRLGYIALAVFILFPAPAWAAWVEAKSENFIFYGDASPKRAQKILGELEEYRALLFQFYSIGVETEPVPVRIYATKSSNDIEDMTGSVNAAGVYTTRREAPLFILNIKGGFHDKSQAKTIALHEYTHHILSQYTDQMYPRWVNEGMAEYLSTFRASDKGIVQIGLPREGRAYSLAAFEWMDWDILTGSIRRYPYGNSGGRRSEAFQSLFYAQSWLAVHYMLSHEELTPKLNEYVAGIPRATDAKVFFTETFGMTPDEFGEKLRAYYKKNSYPGVRITMREGLAKTAVTTRKLSKAERDFHKGEAVRQFRAHKEDGRTLAEAYYADAQKNAEGDTALLATAAQDSDAAQQSIDLALSLDAENARVKHAAAAVALGRYRDPEISSTSEDMKTVRSLFKTAMKASPMNMEAHFDYVMTYVETGDPPSKQAVYSAVECTYHYRSPNLFAENMSLVPVLMRGDEIDAARFHMQRAALWAPTGRARAHAQRMLDNLN